MLNKTVYYVRSVTKILKEALLTMEWHFYVSAYSAFKETKDSYQAEPDC